MTAMRWEEQFSPVRSTTFRSVHAVDEQVVWACGSRGACVYTTDAGETWRPVNTTGLGDRDYRGIFALDAKNVILMASGSAAQGGSCVFRTADGGASWRKVVDLRSADAYLNGLSFLDEHRGFLVCDPIDGRWLIFATQDGGWKWERLPGASLLMAQPGEGVFAAGNCAITFQGESNVMIGTGGGAQARVLCSYDAGKTWSVSGTGMGSGPTSGIFAIRSINTDTIIAVGGDHLAPSKAGLSLKSHDSGRTWESLADTPQLGETLATLQNDDVIVAGPLGSHVSSDGGRSWQSIHGSGFHAVTVAGPYCWGVGGGGIISRLQACRADDAI